MLTAKNKQYMTISTLFVTCELTLHLVLPFENDHKILATKNYEIIAIKIYIKII